MILDLASCVKRRAELHRKAAARVR